MDNNFKLIFTKGNITEAEQQALDRLLDTDFDKIINTEGFEIKEKKEEVKLENVLSAYENDNGQIWLFSTYLAGDKLDAACVILSKDYFTLHPDTMNLNVDPNFESNELYKIIIPE